MVISSTKNQKIVDLRKLSSRKHRRAQNRFVVEGLQLLVMALDAGHIPHDVFYCEENFTGDIAPQLLTRLKKANVNLNAVSQSVMHAISERDTPQGIVAAFPLFADRLDDVLKTSADVALIIVLDRLQDPGNLGTIIRTADATGAAGVILLEPCVDVFDPKTVRGSMGSLFNIPIVPTKDLASMANALRNADYKITGADGYQGELPWAMGSDALSGRTALVLGNEARGLSLDVRSWLTHWVRLPLLGKAESLNVAIAGGVLMYQWVQQNRWVEPRWTLNF